MGNENELVELDTKEEVMFDGIKFVNIGGRLNIDKPLTTTPITMHLLQDRLEYFNQSTDKEVSYKITENFSGLHNYEYIVKNLYCDIESDIDGTEFVYFSDKHDAVYENDLNVIIGFGVDICRVTVFDGLDDEDCGNWSVKITFPDGVVDIERI